jgi:hypothetical protein
MMLYFSLDIAQCLFASLSSSPDFIWWFIHILNYPFSGVESFLLFSTSISPLIISHHLISCILSSWYEVYPHSHSLSSSFQCYVLVSICSKKCTIFSSVSSFIFFSSLHFFQMILIDSTLLRLIFIVLLYPILCCLLDNIWVSFSEMSSWMIWN